MPACILGCGPAGLFAAQACALHSIEPIIMSKKKKSMIYGAQFLHERIPGLTDGMSPEIINIVKIGNELGYAHRVYGDAEVSTSWSKLGAFAHGFSLREVYDRAWGKFEDEIIDVALSYDDVTQFTAEFDLVILTVLAWSICDGTHKFESRNIMVCRQSCEATAGLSLDGNFIVYNGTKYGHWYRTSRIFSHESTESTIKPGEENLGEGWEAGFKVVGTDCDCHPNVYRAGRHGKWERGVLTHHAFETAIAAIHEQALT